MIKLSLLMILFLSVVADTSGATGHQSCSSLMSIMLKKSSYPQTFHPSQRLTINLTDSQKRALYKKAIDAELSTSEIDHFIAGINQLNNHPLDFSLVDSYLQFVKSLPTIDREAALLVISEIDYIDSSSKFIHQFNKIIKKLNKFEEKELLRFEKELNSSGNKKLKQLAQNKALGRRMEYQKIILGCRAKNWTPARINGAKQFKRFILGIGSVSTLGSYSYNHWDEDFNNEWYGKLGYELTMTVFTGWLTAKITSSPKSSNIYKMVFSYLVGRPISLGDTQIYAHLFGTSVKDAEKKLQEILKKPEYLKEIKELIKFLEEKRMYQKYKELILLYASNMLGRGEVATHKAAVSPGTIDWSTLSKKDLQEARFHDILIAAVLAGSYEAQTGEWIKSGDKGFDRFFFYTGYSLLTMAPSVYVNLSIYRILCVGALNPTRALMNGLGIYAINRIIFDQIKYYFSRKAINQ